MWDKSRLFIWLANFLFAFSAVLMLYAALFVIVHLPIFPLREVQVDGELRHVTREQLKLIVGRHIQGNFFTLDLVKVRAAFEKLPWARKVSVRRRWPDKLEVVVEEHQELARWGNIAIVNSYGELFHAASDSDLPVFYGPGDGAREVAEHFVGFSRLLEPAGMKVSQLVLTPRRAWRIRTDKNMVIELGREQMDIRLAKFAGAYAETLGKLDVVVAYADLRYPNGFAVRKPRPGQAVAPKTKPGATGFGATPA